VFVLVGSQNLELVWRQRIVDRADRATVLEWRNWPGFTISR